MLAGLGLHVATIVSCAFLGCTKHLHSSSLNAYMCLLILVYFPLLGSIHSLASWVYPKCKSFHLINQPCTGHTGYLLTSSNGSILNGKNLPDYGLLYPF